MIMGVYFRNKWRWLVAWFLSFTGCIKNYLLICKMYVDHLAKILSASIVLTVLLIKISNSCKFCLQWLAGGVGTGTTSTIHTFWEQSVYQRFSKVDILQCVWRCDNRNLESGKETLLLTKLHYFEEIWEADIVCTEQQRYLNISFKNFYIALFNYRQLMIFIITFTRPWKLFQLLRHTEM